MRTLLTSHISFIQGVLNTVKLSGVPARSKPCPLSPFSSIFFIHCYLETLQHLGQIASRVFGCVPEGCVFLLLCSQCSIVMFAQLILWYMNLMKMVKWIVVMRIQPSICLDNLGKPRKNSVKLVGTGIWTRDLPNASFVHYHGATSLGILDSSVQAYGT